MRVRRSGVVLSSTGVVTRDPFGRDEQGLFLAERFARLDLTRPRHLRAWIAANGAPALASLAPHVRFERSGQRTQWTPPDVYWEDALAEVQSEQAQVRWFLLAFARATEPADRGRWAAPSNPDAWVPPSARLPAHVGDLLAVRRAAALRPIAPRPLGWENWIELLTDIMEPYLRAALQTELTFVPTSEFVEVGLGPPDPPRGWQKLEPGPLALPWDSILCPIYLQLYEALRRLSEGRVAARICDECGEPFLALDARRRRFCSAAERNRYNQRHLRERHSRD